MQVNWLFSHTHAHTDSSLFFRLNPPLSPSDNGPDILKNSAGKTSCSIFIKGIITYSQNTPTKPLYLWEGLKNTGISSYREIPSESWLNCTILCVSFVHIGWQNGRHNVLHVLYTLSGCMSWCRNTCKQWAIILEKEFVGKTLRAHNPGIKMQVWNCISFNLTYYTVVIDISFH